MMQESAYAWRQKAEAFVRQGKYAQASDAYRREAAIRRRQGDVNGAKVEEMKADRWSSEVRLFAHLPDGRPASSRTALALWEPPYGCYIGAFLDRDERLGSPFLDENHQRHQDPEAFARLTGKKHASVFCYLSYGKRFPSRWVSWLKARGVVPHIAFEPNQGLNAVRDDEYLRQFARDAARANWPVFLRFASEMNGNWTRYGGNPLLYRTKWGIVREVMANIAPKVAMVWCVNAIPEKPIPFFYPGDAYVDWVGVNFYSVPFHDNNSARPGLHENPADNLRYIYGQYAARKPLMVCEFGASRMSAVDNRDRSGWAAKKIAELYAALPRIYPRVKLIDIFDNDNLTYAQPGRQLNNYSVTDSETVRAAYARAVSPDYFLSDVTDAPRPTPVVPLKDGQPVPRGILRVSSWARTYSDRFSVTYAVDGREVRKITEFGPYEADIPLPASGPRRIQAIVRDDKGRIAARTEARVVVR